MCPSLEKEGRGEEDNKNLGVCIMVKIQGYLVLGYTRRSTVLLKGWASCV